MKTMLKKVSSMFLVAAFMFSVVPAYAAEPVGASEAESNDSIVAVIPVPGGDDLTYTTLEAAIADSLSGDVITLVADYTLAESVTIPAGVQLTIPTSSAMNDTTTGNNVSGAVQSGSAYVTLTVPADKTLTVNGTLLVAGNQQSTTRTSGCLTGNYGKIDLSGNLVVNNDGYLYARGEVSGSGTVTANSGAEVYQPLKIYDWRGGNASLGAYGVSVFPFNLYEFNSITATTVYHNGSALFGQAFIYAGSRGNATNVPLIGADGQLSFDAATSVDEGNITISHSNGIATAVVNGAVKTGDIAVSMSLLGFTFTINSDGLVCPLGYNMDIVIADGSSLRVSNLLKILPGCDITVEDGGSLTVDSGETLYLYGEGDYSNTYNFRTWPTGDTAPAATLTVEEGGSISGSIASSDETFANVDGYVSSGTTANVLEVTQSNTSVTRVNVPFYIGTAVSD